LIRLGISTQYIHSDVETLERVDILQNLRAGTIDVLVGVNLLREGLDLPEVSLVAIMDADKEGFLRCERSLTQTAGRAARHVNGRVIFYANTITKSMQATLDETARRRAKQLAYNELHHITPRSVKKAEPVLTSGAVAYGGGTGGQQVAAEPVESKYLNAEQLQTRIKSLRKQMEAAAKDLDFKEAVRLRDLMKEAERLLKEQK
jgi:excinuclease ABC subunit B